MGNVSRWMDKQGETVIYGDIGVCVRVGKVAKCHSAHGCRRKIPLQDVLTCKFHRLRVYGSD